MVFDLIWISWDFSLEKNDKLYKIYKSIFNESNTLYIYFFFISNYLKIKEISLDVTIYMVIFCICASFYYPHDQNNKHIYILLYKMIKWQSIMSASVCIFLSVCSVLVDIILKKTLRFLSSSFLNISKTLLLWLQNFLQILKIPK